ncbi:AbgT family transporter [Bacillus sp. FSL K6-0047]|uniref:AbgT family transporter n=1 Tax=Shouchella clausii TaxID=79880 RepID=UPI000BA76207|nr:AbgT family transporter [Shouchella clausii]MDO7269422.1 AbgT family transporter [Shouchella clausii]MDO7289304.1 AbgT family transporter [Shouchella clausii]PAD46498.1 aminobenzoyl-glutamate transporter [Shouchella clausii]
MSTVERKKRIFQRFLDGIEKAGNKLPHPVTLFAILAVLVVVISSVVASFGISVEDPANPGETIAVKNLLSGEGISYIFTSMVDNFIGFAPLGVVLATMLGIGICERSGLISAGLRGFVLSIPNRLITAGLVFAAVMSSVASDAGYVVLPPLGAVIYAALGRHPLAGLATAFAGVSGGFSANLLLSATDPMLGELTMQAAATVDPVYAEQMNNAMNYWFIIVSTILITIVGTIVSEKIVEPRLGTYKGDYTGELERLTPIEKKGMLYAGIAFAVSAALISLLVVPEWGPMRGTGDQPIVVSPFMDSLVVIILLLFLIPGLVYGIVTKNIKSDKDVAKQMTDTMASMGMFIVLAFTAGQFVAYFSESNLGLFLGILGGEMLTSLNLDGIPVVIGFILITAFINLFVGSASAKWAMMAPVFVPIMMQIGYSPELAQATYRVADSATNIITPLMTYFAIVIAFAQKYDKNMGIGTLISVMLPFSIWFLISWSLLLIVWIFTGLPLGPNAPIYMP